MKECFTLYIFKRMKFYYNKTLNSVKSKSNSEYQDSWIDIHNTIDREEITNEILFVIENNENIKKFLFLRK